MDDCINCGCSTDNPKFCSRSCSAKYNKNRKGTGMSIGNCRYCGNPKNRPRDVYCRKCIDSGEHRRCKKSSNQCKSPAALRRYLFRTRNHKCSVCENDTWMGSPIPLEVDHINGDAYDNEEKNVRLVCLNCHAQTPTWKSYNKNSSRQYRRKRYNNGQTY